jgi:hypothetical protein
MTRFDDLPNELVLLLARYLSVKSCLRLLRTARRIHDVLRSDSNLGRFIYANAFPESSTEHQIYTWIMMMSMPASDLTHSPALLSTVVSSSPPLASHLSAASTPPPNTDMFEDTGITPWSTTNVVTETMDWWYLLRRRGMIDLNWRRLAPKQCTFPLPESIQQDNINIVAVRPWGMVIAASGQQDQLFWVDRRATEIDGYEPLNPSSTDSMVESVEAEKTSKHHSPRHTSVDDHDAEDYKTDDFVDTCEDTHTLSLDTAVQVPQFVADVPAFSCEFDFMVPVMPTIPPPNVTVSPGVSSFVALELGDAVPDFYKRCEVNEHYIVHFTWISSLKAAGIHVWRIGCATPWLVLATAEYCWIVGLDHHWLVLRQRERFENQYHLCVINLQTRQRYASLSVPMHAGRHIHGANATMANLWICTPRYQTTMVGAEMTDETLYIDWSLWHAPRLSWSSSIGFIDLAATTSGTATSEAPVGTPSLTCSRHGKFALPNTIFLNDEGRSMLPYASTLYISDTQVLLQLRPSEGKDFTHLALLMLNDHCENDGCSVVWQCVTRYTGVEPLPGRDLLLTWCSETGIHQVYRLSTGQVLRSFFGRRWHPALPAIDTLCVMTVPSAVQLSFALMDVSAGTDESDTARKHHPQAVYPVLLDATDTVAPGVLGQLALTSQIIEAVCPAYCCVKTSSTRLILDFAYPDESGM